MDDLGEAAAEESQRCLSLVAARATQSNLVDVLDAIRRIERGTYGICEMTGKRIEAERLRAIPWTRYSLGGPEASVDYQRVTVDALRHLCKRSNIDFYCRYYKRFRGYLKNRTGGR